MSTGTVPQIDAAIEPDNEIPDVVRQIMQDQRADQIRTQNEINSQFATNRARINKAYDDASEKISLKRQQFGMTPELQELVVLLGQNQRLIPVVLRNTKTLLTTINAAIEKAIQDATNPTPSP